MDIDVDPDVLEDFARALANFQDNLEQQLQSLNTEWSRCSETFKGRQRDEFEQNFDRTKDAMEKSVEAGRQAAEKLSCYQEVVREILG